MKTKQRTALIAVLFLATVTGCVKDNTAPDCGEGPIVIPITVVEDENQVHCAIQNIAENQLTVNLIIRSQADYEKHIICGGTRPPVDFSKYFVLAGRTKLPNCGMLKAQRAELKCDQLEYIVEIENMDCHMLTNVPYAAVIPRQYDDASIVFTVKKD